MNYDVVAGAFALMLTGPRPLSAALRAASAVLGGEVSSDDVFAWVQKSAVGDPIRSIVHQHLTQWDYQPTPSWGDRTISNTPERRARIYSRLELSPLSSTIADDVIPVYREAEPIVVISEEFEAWYTSARRDSNAFYWSAYRRYLRDISKWPEESVASLERSTNEIVARISDPTRAQNYQTKGLVVGHVQSGKTANFTGVIARASDAGYRLVIVLAGTLDILRRQTQRRLDKELIGKELITGLRTVPENGGAEHDYELDAEWEDFVTHGGFPSEKGAFDWQRLTGYRDDYQTLKRGIDALEFERSDPKLPFFDSANLARAKARLLVIKKNKTRINNLASDLRRIRAKMDHIPALVIDDESDQASLNTRPPQADVKARTAVNAAIVNLLAQLPKAQYVGYTATPFANVFVDPEDAADLFPKDFIVSLDRPVDYMGIRDFHDLDGMPEGYASNERAFIRPVRGEDNDLPNLPTAVDAFVLSGAIKLYRAERGLAVNTKHHTMLIHTSHRQADHDAMRRKVRATLDAAGYEAGPGLARLRELYETDFVPVSLARLGGDTVVPSFQVLKRHIGQCLQRLFDGGSPVLIVNQANEADTPDFEGSRQWRILVGGAKLSRGYTVEGLTVSYYRRTSSAADTLMQMGRWFGFRPGYKDLVRVFIGRDEPNGTHGRIDLYEAFEAVCRDEEEFRDRLRLYSTPQDGQRPVRPSEVPPLVPSHIAALRPTSKNKMYNAVVKWENLSGDFVERTLAPTEEGERSQNERLMRSVLEGQNIREVNLSMRLDASSPRIDSRALVADLTPAIVERLIREFHWEKPNIFARELDYIGGKFVDPALDRWLLYAPQLVSAESGTWRAAKRQWTIVERSRVGARQHGRYSDPGHVKMAELLASVGNGEPLSADAADLRRPKQGVLLVYAVRFKQETTVNPVFALHFPTNPSPKRIEFGVRDPGRPDDVVIPRK